MIIRTTTDLKMLRRTLGLSLDQAAELCEVKPQTIISHERGRSKYLLPRCIERYTNLWNEVCRYERVMMEWPAESLLVVYGKQEDFERHEPWASRLLYFTVHAQAVANFNLSNGKDWTLVEFNPIAYWGGDVLDWAAEYVKRYEVYKGEKERVR
jgi:DNA-binding XRE family transcriptional regulator